MKSLFLYSQILKQRKKILKVRRNTMEKLRVLGPQYIYFTCSYDHVEKR